MLGVVAEVLFLTHVIDESRWLRGGAESATRDLRSDGRSSGSVGGFRTQCERELFRKQPVNIRRSKFLAFLHPGHDAPPV